MWKKSVLITIAAAVVLYLSCGAGFAGESVATTDSILTEVIKLPDPTTSGGLTLNEALAKRRSIRSYEDAPITKEQLSQILWSAQGITEPKRGLRTAPSAMAAYPLDIYAVTADGVFKYIPKDHSLQVLKKGDNRTAFTEGMRQAWLAKAALNIVIVSVPERMKRFGDRGKNWAAYEAGAVAQNALLEATALGFGSCTVGGFDPAKTAQFLGLASDMEVVIILPIGKAAK